MNFTYSDTQNLGFTFVCIRKNASTSIKSAIYSLKNEISYEDESFPKDVNGTGTFIYRPKNAIPDLSNTFNFICLRDPFERIVSFFIHKIINHPHVEIREYVNKYPDYRKHYNALEQGFDHFLKFLAESDLSNVDEHFAYQYDCGAFDQIKYNLVLDFNNMNWDMVRQSIPGMPNLPADKIHSTNSHYAVQQLKNFEPRVKDLYKKDYDLIKDLKAQGMM